MELLYFLQPLLLYLALFLFIRHRRKEMDKEVRKAQWERDAELGRMVPAQRLSAVVHRFGWIMCMAAQRFAAFNMMVLGLVGWFFFLSPLPAGGDTHIFFVFMILALSLATRQGTLRGPAAQEARVYKVFEWGYAGRWLDLGFATVVAGAAALTFQKYIAPLILGVYLGVAGVVIIMLLRWGIFGRKPWNPFARKDESGQERTA
ncbi:hypothetical protein HY477_00560 [Candidatus Uhrbacteria bacterium]|nr:hypothetical protein [Candidatus Uhrbacteria bacterium]